MLSRQAVLQQARQRLQDAGVETAALDASLLLAHVLGCRREELFLSPDAPLTADQADTFEALVQRRSARQPLAQLTGVRAFWKAEFLVTPEVLIPRPDTETMIEAVLETYAAQPPKHILEFGVGSGCILLSLLQEYPTAQGYGVDVSPAALAMAQRNAEYLALAARVRWMLSDWDAALPPDWRAELLVSNPPYIMESDRATLAPEVAVHEPALALFGGADGLDAYRALALAGKRRILPGGRFFLEIGDGQEAQIMAIFGAEGWRFCRNWRDLSQKARIVLFDRPAD